AGHRRGHGRGSGVVRLGVATVGRAPHGAGTDPPDRGGQRTATWRDRTRERRALPASLPREPRPQRAAVAVPELAAVRTGRGILRAAVASRPRARLPAPGLRAGPRGPRAARRVASGDVRVVLAGRPGEEGRGRPDGADVGRPG